MFQAYSNTSTTYAQNAIIELPKIKVDDCRMEHNGLTEITIKSAGKYLVQFNGVGSSGTSASQFTVQLYKDDQPVTDAFSTVTSTLANELHTLSFNTIITVPRSCCVIDGTTRLSLVATSSVTGALTLANIVITKLR